MKTELKGVVVSTKFQPFWVGIPRGFVVVAVIRHTGFVDPLADGSVYVQLYSMFEFDSETETGFGGYFYTNP